MTKAFFVLLILVAGAAAVPAASAHSLDELEGQLTKQELSFQAVSRPAPAFTLQGSDGQPHSLSDWKGKVMVLWFIYTNCPDVCPLHTDAMARSANDQPDTDESSSSSSPLIPSVIRMRCCAIMVRFTASIPPTPFF
jgi:cytochrome oxidase Cu insertion factor (SCO1/SenC/PrrC family)